MNWIRRLKQFLKIPTDFAKALKQKTLLVFIQWKETVAKIHSLLQDLYGEHLSICLAGNGFRAAKVMILIQRPMHALGAPKRFEEEDLEE